MSHRKNLLSIAMVLVMLMMVIAPISAAAEEVRTLTVWHAALVSSIEQETMAEEDWIVSRIVREYEEMNPGVKIDMIFEADQAILQSKLKAATLAGTAPDIANIYSGYLVTSLSDVFVDIKDLIPADDLEKIIGWEALSHDLDMSKQIYGYPASGAEMGILLYNKELVAQAGVDLEGEGKPKNAEEFMDALRKIHATGVQPIIARDSGYNSAFMFSFGNWWTQQSGTERVTSNSLGITKFAEDEGYLSAIGMVAQMYAEGLLNKDYMTIADAGSLFFMGEAAMLVDGNWGIQQGIEQLGEDNLGLYLAPNFVEDVPHQNATIGGVGQALCVMQTCEDPALAVDFLSFFSNKQNATEMCLLNSKLPQRIDITAEDLGWAGRPVFEKVLAAAMDNLLPWNDNSMQSDVMNDYYKQSSLAVIGTITPLESAQALDATAAQAAAQ